MASATSRAVCVRRKAVRLAGCEGSGDEHPEKAEKGWESRKGRTELGALVITVNAVQHPHVRKSVT